MKIQKQHPQNTGRCAMKHLLLVISIMAISIMALSGGALAADTTTVAVSANVTGTCKFTTSGAVAFVLDPGTGGNVSGTVVQPTFWCTKNATYTISDDNGLWPSGTTHRMRHNTLTTEFIPYSFTYTTTGTGSGPATSLTMDIASTVVEADYLNAAAGNYSDTVTMTISP